jgi:histidinol-phosphate aminotransferase
MELREDLRDLKPYAPGKLRPGALKLASNENPLGPSPRAIEALAAAAASVHVYPDGATTALREALAQSLGVPADHIVVGNGSDEILTLIAGAYLRPGDNAVTADVTFSEYNFAVRLFGSTMRFAPLSGGAFDLEAVADRIDSHTKLVFLCNPNNPTGGYFTQTALEAFLGRVPSTALVVLDEAYCHYVEADDYPDSIPLLKSWPNLLITRTFSKVYGLAALRVGYALASPQVIGHLSVVKQPFNVGTLGQIAARAALADKAFVEKSRAVNREGVAFWQQSLARLGLASLPTQANFIAVGVARDAQQVFTAMAEAGVTIRPLTSFGLPDWIRITIGTREQNELCVAALSRALDSVPLIR